MVGNAAITLTSLNSIDFKNVGFQKLALNLSAYESIKDAFLFPFPKILGLI
jgi:hypothetical protein